MRELQIHAAAMQIEIGAEQTRRHRGALDVPTGASAPPRRLPRRLAWLRVLPKHEIEGIELGLVDQGPRHRYDGCDEIGGARLEIRGLQPESGAVLVHGLREASCE